MRFNVINILTICVFFVTIGAICATVEFTMYLYNEEHYVKTISMAILTVMLAVLLYLVLFRRDIFQEPQVKVAPDMRPFYASEEFYAVEETIPVQGKKKKKKRQSKKK